MYNLKLNNYEGCSFEYWNSWFRANGWFICKSCLKRYGIAKKKYMELQIVKKIDKIF